MTTATKNWVVVVIEMCGRTTEDMSSKSYFYGPYDKEVACSLAAKLCEVFAYSSPDSAEYQSDASAMCLDSLSPEDVLHNHKEVPHDHCN